MNRHGTLLGAAAALVVGCGGGGGGAPPSNQAPVATILSPGTSATIAAGGSVTFTGSCADPDGDLPLSHLWTFAGGAPISTAANPGAVTFASAGTYAVTYTCTDAKGLSSSAVGRTVTVTGSGGAQGWTILVYGAADNDLEPFMLLDLEEMAQGASAGVNIVAQVDRSVDYSADGVLGLPNWTTAKRLQVSAGAITQLSDLGEIDTADPASLASFIEWGVRTYPSAHTMLVLWDHGGGWGGFGVDEQRAAGGARTFALMDLAAITAGISSGLAAAGLPRLDLIGFDACLMATVEVASSLRPYASYLLASEETEPGHGWNYAALNGAASLSPVQLGTRLADGFQAQAESAQWETGAAITLSLVDLSRIPDVLTAIAGLRNAYGTPASVAGVSSAIGRERAAAVSFGRNPDPAKATQLVDVGDLFGSLPELGATATALRSAAAAAVVYQVRGSSYAGATGLSIYFPTSQAYYKASAYDSLPGMGDWRTFLSAYYGTGSSSSAPAFSGGQYYATATDLTLHGALQAGALATTSTAMFVYGVPGGSGDAWVYGDSPVSATSVGGTDYLVGSWDYGFLRLTQASHAEFGYLSVSVNGTEGFASVPFFYYASAGAPAQPAFRLITLDLVAGAVTSDVYYLINPSGAVGQLYPASGSRMRAVVLHLPSSLSWSSQWVESTTAGSFDATQPIALDFPTLSSGAPFYVGMRIEDAAGNGDYIATDVSSPPTKP